jgi:hypothetical protein
MESEEQRMKVSELLKGLNGLDDFEIILRVRDESDTYGISYKDIDFQIDDVGYSDKIVILGEK